nr:helix-turn-helix domain-containing protein [uncultured Arsenicibacter sp.]
MRFNIIIPSESLQPYVRHFVILENEAGMTYKVFPSTGMVIGFQYRGRLATVSQDTETHLATAGISGMTDSYTVFRNSPHIGTILVYFTETGFARFSKHPAHELFNQRLSLDLIFDNASISETEDRLSQATTDQQRIQLVERFLRAHLKAVETDKLIIEAVKLIYQSKGAIRIWELNERLAISQSPFEKRFRKLVGTTPKKFASIVRFNTVLSSLDGGKSLADICYENNFFDQAHFSKDFKLYTGEAPEHFRRFL